MAYPSLRERYHPLHVAPPDLLQGCYRGRTKLFLTLLAKQPSELNVGQLNVRTRVIKLAPSIQWPEHNGGATEVPLRKIQAVVASIRNCLKRLGLPVGIWINGPTWDGGKYRSMLVPVEIGLVDLRKPLPSGQRNGDRAA